jgi:hypothetical protein
VVLEVAADAGQLGAHLDAVRGELVGGPDAREHEQLRRQERARA